MTLDVKSWNQHALANRIQTLLLLMVMGAFMLLLGLILWGIEGIIILALAGALLLLFSPALTPQLIMRMYGASRLPMQQAPVIYAIIDELSRRAKLTSAPAVYYIPSGIINAFSVGRPGNAGIGITDGFLRNMNTDEAIGVLAHEISHIRNNDMGVMGLADMFSRLTSMLSLLGQLLLLVNLPLILLTDVSINWFAILLLILAPTICALAQMGLSRTREFDADLNAARLTGNPEGLASALVKIERLQGGWLERLFFPGRRVPEPSLLRTHPPTDQRVRRLLELELPENLYPLQWIESGSLNHSLARMRVQRRPKWHFNGLWH